MGAGVFSDFQCRFCKQFADLYKNSIGVSDNSQLSFKFRPLASHDWARKAAFVASCAALQGNNHFWNTHDYLFDNQSRISASNIESHITTIKQSDKSLNSADFDKCISNETTKETITLDEALAARYRVQETPTIFINGVRKRGISSELELRDAISEEIAASEESGRSSKTLR